MRIKLLASVVIAALLMTGTGYAVSNDPGQGAQLPQPSAETTPAVPVTLTEQEALALALEYAGYTEADVTMLSCRPDTDERIPHWDVQWRVGDWEYEGAVHMETGEILEWERDFDPVPTVPTQPPAEPAATQPPAPAAGTQTAAAQSSTLTREEALKIALDHAGLREDQIHRLEREFDRDNGRPEWDVEFVSGDWEYSYEIHGETGKILDWDREWND